MTTLFASTRRIKPTNVAFGRGILRQAPTHRVDYTASDASEAAAMFAADDADRNRKAKVARNVSASMFQYDAILSYENFLATH